MPSVASVLVVVVCASSDVAYWFATVARKLFQGENADIVIVHSQITAVGFQLGIAYLPVEVARAA